MNLEVQIAGLSRPGCEVEVRPAHAGCQFTRVVKRVEGRPGSRTAIQFESIRAQSTNADRDCAFAITIREPGQAPKTFRRGLRLNPQEPDRPVPVQWLKCYLSSPSLVAREAESRPRR